MKDWIPEAPSTIKFEEIAHSISGELDVLNAKWGKVGSYLIRCQADNQDITKYYVRNGINIKIID